MEKTRLCFGAYVIMSAVAGCSLSPAEPLSAVLVSEGPAKDFVSGGSIDAISYAEAGNQVTIEGWHMLTPKSKVQRLSVLADGAISVASINSRARPDVVEAVGNNDLLNSGFVLVLDLEDDTPMSRLCIMVDDSHYGRRLLNPHSSAFPPCFVS